MVFGLRGCRAVPGAATVSRCVWCAAWVGWRGGGVEGWLKAILRLLVFPGANLCVCVGGRVGVWDGGPANFVEQNTVMDMPVPVYVRLFGMNALPTAQQLRLRMTVRRAAHREWLPLPCACVLVLICVHVTAFVLIPGASEFDLLSRITETIGPPPKWLLTEAKHAGRCWCR